MSDAFWNSLPAILVSIGGLIGVLVNILITLGNRKVSMATHATVVEAKEIAQKTELNTNSMRVALVAATAVASRAEGKEEGRVEGELRAANLAAVQKKD